MIVFKGGTFALYSLLRQHLNFKSEMVMSLKSLDSDANLQFHSTRSSIQSKAKRFLEESFIAQKIITYIVLLGTCMVIGDGALTPAISGILHSKLHIYSSVCSEIFSFIVGYICWLPFCNFTVLSAVQGIQSRSPKITQSKYLNNFSLC